MKEEETFYHRMVTRNKKFSSRPGAGASTDIPIETRRFVICFEFDDSAEAASDDTLEGPDFRFKL